MSQVRGLPLLSGPPPHMESGDACRKCNKEFNMFLNRSRKCNHCGFLYCNNCSDYQALMPRAGQVSGYDAMPVCTFCIDFLNVTAAGKGALKNMQLSKLKKYLEAYNIEIGRVFDKDDLIEVILKARMPNGCLRPENEDYYRNYSVPDKSTSHTRSSFFGRSAGQSSNRSPASTPQHPPSNTRPYDFPRPDLEPNPPPERSHASHPGPPPPPHQTRPSYQTPPPIPPRHPHQPPHHQHYHQQYRQQPHQHHQHSHYSPPPRPPPPPQTSRPTGYPQYQRPSASRSTENLRRPSPQQPRQRAASAAPPPTLDQLLDMSDDSIKSLSIGALKSILFTNHVNSRQILEKGDLITKVKALIDDERRDRDRQRALQEAEEREEMERQRVMMDEHRRTQERERAKTEQQGQGQGQAETGGVAERSGSFSGEGPGESAAAQIQETKDSAQASTPSAAPTKTRGTAADLERTGLCVICQDEEANIAIVDCGHLAMCRGCSDLIMASSRECPLCRTRIITESRLLRIFKT